MRLDQFLVEKKWVASRTKAQDLVHGGHVKIKINGQEKSLTKPSFEVTDENAEFIFLESNKVETYVSRGGLKLEHALKQVPLDVTGMTALDVGQSTGGFTDCLLKHKASHVVGVEVGHGQLHASLDRHSQVTAFERLHVRNLETEASFKASVPAKGFQLIVGDVSFISLTQIIQYVEPYLALGGHYLFLVKPQFEAGPDALDKNGLVKDEKYYVIVEDKMRQKFVDIFGQVQKYFPSEPKGKDGNQEFFIYGTKSKNEQSSS